VSPATPCGPVRSCSPPRWPGSPAASASTWRASPIRGAYGPSLSLKLLLAVLIGGGASALGGPAGIGVLSVVTLVGRNAAGFSDQLATRLQTVFAAVFVLALLPDDPEGLVPALGRRRGAPPRARTRAAPLPACRRPATLRALAGTLALWTRARSSSTRGTSAHSPRNGG
jgi:hypothetical protein